MSNMHKLAQWHIPLLVFMCVFLVCGSYYSSVRASLGAPEAFPALIAVYPAILVSAIFSSAAYKHLKVEMCK